ncbi:MAPEG family protein [Mesorhizobium sp.]|uniref:MAPEG family protein n=1 Tax=Mesorhizobium sp. TaxID=1871066 RepID=UPI00338F3FC1
MNELRTSDACGEFCLIQIVVSSHAASFQRGYRWTASSRDAEVSPLTGVAGRLERALRNFLETFPVFVVAVFLVHVLGRESALSEWGAGLYFPPDWFTFYSTQRAFLCSGRSSGMPRSLELSFFCSLQSGPSYSARMPTAVTSRSSASMPS